MSNSSKSKKVSKSHESVNAWREARIAHYALTRSVHSLARMVVELEDDPDHPCTPEFEHDDEWPASVEHMRVK